MRSSGTRKVVSEMRRHEQVHGLLRRRAGSAVRGMSVVVITVALVAVGCTKSDTNNAGPTPGGTGGGTPAAELPACPVDALAKANGPVEVVVWHTQAAKPGDTLQALVDQYNASQTKVKVRLESQGSDYAELVRKFNSAIPTKQLPGLIMVDDTSTQSMADSKVVLPAQSCINADHVDMKAFVKTAVDYYTINGVVWPASADLGNILLFYNKEHFRKAGLDPEKTPKTLAELRDDAAKIKAAGVVDKPFVHEVSSWKTEFWLTGAHAPVVNNDNGRSASATGAALVGNPTTLQLFEWFKKMNDDGLLQPIPATEGQVNQYFAMANQQASMLVESSSAATSVEAFLGGNLDTSKLGAGDQTVNRSGLDIGGAVFPGLDANGRTQMGGAAWYIINTTPPEVQAAAWDFMKFMNGDDAQTKMLTGGSFLPYRTSAAQTPAAQQFFSASLSGKWLKIANDQVQNIDPAFPGPLIGPYTETRNALRDAMDNMLFKGTSPQDSIAGAQKEIDAALKRYSEEGF